MKGKDAPRHRIRVGVVAKQCLRARSHIFEPDLAFLADEMFRHIRDVTSRLLGIPRKRSPLGFGLDHATELPANKQAIVHGPRSGLEFAHRHSQAGSKIHFSLGLNQPSTRDQPPVNRRPGLVLGMEGGFVHFSIYGVDAAARQISGFGLLVC
jgi:hypothetical protein